MKTESMDITTLWATLVVEELIRSGVRTFVISPGSRSTPLALAVGSHRDADTVTHFDERGAAFFALGHARGTKVPAVLICTSGTAVANYFPAVIESAMDHVPMLILSADRPPELLGTGANQTIRQSDVFGDYTRWRSTLPCPDQAIPAEFVLTTVDQAIYRSLRAPSGPVHLNFQFREPLTPDPNRKVPKEYLSSVADWVNHKRPYTTYVSPELAVSTADRAAVADGIARAKSGLLIVGRLKQRADEIDAVTTLANRLGWPVVSDIGSGLRLGAVGLTNHLPHFDLSLLRQSARTGFDSILHLGGPLVSKRTNEFLAMHGGEYIVVNDHSERQDSGHRVTRRIECDVAAFAHALAALMPENRSVSRSHDLTKTDQAIANEIEATIDAGNLSEPLVPRIIARGISSGDALFVASSLPIRDFDMYAPAVNRTVSVGSNRGASGIDGTLASATGFARGLNRPMTLVIGDTALLHDLNSLALLQTPGLPPVTIVVINNGGGAIFSMLAVADLPTEIAGPGIFEKLFLQGHMFNFRSAAEMFDIEYHNPHDAGSFQDTYRSVTAGNQSTLIELTFDWRESRGLRLELRERIIARMNRR